MLWLLYLKSADGHTYKRLLFANNRGDAVAICLRRPGTKVISCYPQTVQIAEARKCVVL